MTKTQAFLGVAFLAGVAFLGVAFLADGLAVFFAAAFLGVDVPVVLVTRPDLVLLRTEGFSTMAGACIEICQHRT